MFAITLALMVVTSGLPHVIVRFFTVPKVSDARKSAGYAMICIAILYTTATAVAAFSRVNFIESIQEKSYLDYPDWFKNWENIGLIAWKDKNDDGLINYSAGKPFKEGRPDFLDSRGIQGEREIKNPSTTDNDY